MDALRRYALAGCSELVDIGANITRARGADLDRLLQRSDAAGVRRILLTGTSHKVTADAQRMARQNRSPVALYYTAGIHPHDANAFCADATPPFLEKHLADPLCVAVGETGLDYDRMRAPREQQLRSFAAHVQIAKKRNKPLFIHERDLDAHKGPRLGSHADLVAILDAHDFPGHRVCIHCFTGTAADLQDYVERGYFVGITGFVAKKNRGAALRMALSERVLPAERLMVETDAPYMRPDTLPTDIGVGDRTNEPCVLPTVVRVLAECYGQEPSKLANTITDNTLRFFNLPAAGPRAVRE